VLSRAADAVAFQPMYLGGFVLNMVRMTSRFAGATRDVHSLLALLDET
jgi:hypothetical protein